MISARDLIWFGRDFSYIGWLGLVRWCSFKLQLPNSTNSINLPFLEPSKEPLRRPEREKGEPKWSKRSKAPVEV